MKTNYEKTINDWSKKTILIVENSFQDYLLIRKLLEDTKVNFLLAKTTEVTINYCEKFKRINLIIVTNNSNAENEKINTIRELLKISPYFKKISESLPEFDVKIKEEEIKNTIKELFKINSNQRIIRMTFPEFEIKIKEIEVINKTTGQIIEFELFLNKMEREMIKNGETDK